MTDIAIISDMVKQSEEHADNRASERTKANEYFRGEMRDTPAAKNRSKVVSKDLRAHLNKVLPSIVRTILGNDEVVEYQPVGEGDEESAQQASDYVNYVVFPEIDGYSAIYSAVFDALLQRNGVLKWWFDERQTVKISKHSGLTEMELAALLEGGAEILEQAASVEMIEGQPVEVYSVKIKRVFVDRKVCAAAVPLERFLIHPDATSVADSLLTGEKTTLRRSDLIAMGYDRDMVMKLRDAEREDDDDRREHYEDGDEAQRVNEEIDYYELYVRIDLDGDGIAELRRMCFAGGLGEENLLENDECDEVQFCTITAMPLPHQWEGSSLADDLMEIQQVKTVLQRQTLDNLYWQNNPQPIVDAGAVEDWSAVMEPRFGLPIRIRQGFDAAKAVQFRQVPFVARESFSMLEYLDKEAQDRTGISDASSGMAPDALQNMTAKASAMIEQAGIGRTEMMVRSLAHGLKAFYKGILSLIIRHQDKPRTVRLRDEWVTFDPQHWNAEMDAVVNVGLGAGTRERDMMMMQMVMGVQEKLLSAFGPDNPFVKPEHLHNAISKLIEAAGLRTPGLYIAEPDPQEIAQKMQAAKNQPNPEMEKMKAEMQLKQADAQMKMQLEQAKMQASQAKERAQMEADLAVRDKEIQAETLRQQADLESKAALEAQRIAWEREKFQAELQMRSAEMQQRREDELNKWQAERFSAEQPAVAAE